MRVLLMGLILAVLLAGCASTQAPLVYVSKQTLGVEVSGGAQDAGSASVVLGFRNVDVAFVPTTAANKDGSKVIKIRGCYNAGHNVGRIGSCDKEGDIFAEKKSSKEDASSNAGNAPEFTVNGPLQDMVGKLRGNVKHMKALDPGDSGVIVPEADQNKNSVIVPGDSIGEGNQSQSVSDSLSTYGTFDSGTKASSSGTGVTLGKVFATGVAAQNLTEGISLRDRRIAKGAYMEQKTACVKAVKDALGDKTTGTDLAICN